MTYSLINNFYGCLLFADVTFYQDKVHGGFQSFDSLIVRDFAMTR